MVGIPVDILVFDFPQFSELKTMFKKRDCTTAATLTCDREVQINIPCEVFEASHAATRVLFYTIIIIIKEDLKVVFSLGRLTN